METVETVRYPETQVSTGLKPGLNEITKEVLHTPTKIQSYAGDIPAMLYSLAPMKRFHLIFGILVVVIFLLTGQYMDKFLHHLAGMPDGPRMLYRTRHIYILLAGLVNLGIGTYFTYGVTRWSKVLQFLGSGLIVAATALFIVGFFTEPKLSGLQTPWSGQGIYLIAYGTLLHFFSSLGRTR